MDEKITKTDEEWRAELSSEAYRVTRQEGTERPFSHPYNDEKADGVYHCVSCAAPLFEAGSKFDSGTGWPSFFQPANAQAVSEHVDRRLFSRRTEIRCARCEAHLGHVFKDGPQPSGLRYCMNGVALDFDKKGDDQA